MEWAKLAEIDLHCHDLRHEAGSCKLEAGWPLHAVSAFLGHANVTTTARYPNVKDDYLQRRQMRGKCTETHDDPAIDRVSRVAASWRRGGRLRVGATGLEPVTSCV